MTAEDGECGELLVDQRLGRQGLEVKLDRGFESGIYCGYIEFEALASRVGFAAAPRAESGLGSLIRSGCGFSFPEKGHGAGPGGGKDA